MYLLTPSMLKIIVSNPSTTSLVYLAEVSIAYCVDSETLQKGIKVSPKMSKIALHSVSVEGKPF